MFVADIRLRRMRQMNGFRYWCRHHYDACAKFNGLIHFYGS